MTKIRPLHGFLLFFLVSLLIVITGCSSDPYPRPTKEYYINDYAHTLMNATRSTIVREGERLFDWTKEEENGGAQIVFATFEVQTLSEIADYDKTDLFRQWRIGKNDMGILVVMFFMETIVEDVEYLELVETQIEIGYRMEQYLTPSEAGLIVDTTLYNEEWDGFLDMGVAHLLYELLTVVYIEAYGYESFNYDMDLYLDYLINYSETPLDDSIPMSLIFYLLSPYSTLWEKISAVLPFVIVFFLTGSIGFARNKGGGGSSGGMGIFRRRR